MLKVFLFIACFVFSTASLAALSHLADRFNAVNAPSVRLDFKEFIIALPNGKKRVSQQRVLAKLLIDIQAYQSSMTQCEKQQLAQLKYAVEHQLELIALLDKFGKPDYKNSFYTLQQGEMWYAFWRKTWLQDSVSTEQLKVIAEHELNAALNYLNKQPKPPAYLVDYQNAKKITARFSDIEHTLSRTLETEFGLPLTAVKPVTIAQSTMASNFPAPGYYNPAQGRFYYHSNNQSFDLNSAAWLYLHEASPGHHFQAQLALQNQCNPVLPSLIFSEGWAAYVESIASQLGILKNTGEAYYIWQWQALRAVRVLIDIGIHQQGWSDQQAYDYWQSRLPYSEPAIIKREINRIRNWPAQVISYVYGKHQVQQVLKRLSNQHSSSLKHAHKTLLQNQILFNLRSQL